MTNFLLILLAIVVIYLAGFGTGFFVMRNNPKYFDIDKMLKKIRDDKKPEFIAYLKKRVGQFI